MLTRNTTIHRLPHATKREWSVIYIVQTWGERGRIRSTLTRWESDHNGIMTCAPLTDAQGLVQGTFPRVTQRRVDQQHDDAVRRARTIVDAILAAPAADARAAMTESE